MDLDEHFLATSNSSIRRSASLTEKDMIRLIIGSPKNISSYDYRIYTPLLEGARIVGDAFCDIRPRTIIAQDGNQCRTLQIGYIAVNPLLYDRGISKLLTEHVISQAREQRMHLSFLFPAGCESMAQKIGELERGVQRYENSSEFGYLLPLREKPHHTKQRIVMPDMNDLFAAPV